MTGVQTLLFRSLGVSAGLNANTYEREHTEFIRTDLTRPTYLNTGHKQDVSAFAKLSVIRGALTWFTDLQLRHARFRYAPDRAAGFGSVEPSIVWTFFNPKIGVTWAAQPAMELFASVGRTTREPTRSDLLAGNDNVSRATFDDLGGLKHLEPERVTSTEAGVRWHSDNVRVELNAFRMDFRNEIARIGALSPLGAELRSNVGASVRQGVELDLRWKPVPSLALTTVGALSRNRIRQFTDSSGATPVIRRDVPPLLSPAVSGTQRADWRAASWLDLGLEARYQGMSYLRNDGNNAFTLPSYAMFDAMLRVAFRGSDITIRGANLGNSSRYGSGYEAGGVPNYFILPPRSVFVTVRLSTR